MPTRKLPPNDEVIAMYESGMSSGEIAEQCGVAGVTVLSLLRRIGHKTRMPKEAAILSYQRGRNIPSSYWQGKTQPAEMVERRASKIRGEAHYLWKGGVGRRLYRKGIEKYICIRCGVTENLGIHHSNFDHYDNVPDNLTILCVSCHMSIHKQAYWDAVHSGQEPPKSNGPVGWQRKEGGD